MRQIWLDCRAGTPDAALQPQNHGMGARQGEVTFALSGSLRPVFWTGKTKVCGDSGPAGQVVPGQSSQDGLNRGHLMVSGRRKHAEGLRTST